MKENEILKELQDIKKLFILHLVKSGATTREIRNILKISGTNFKKLLPIKKVKTYKL